MPLIMVLTVRDLSLEILRHHLSAISEKTSRLRATGIVANSSTAAGSPLPFRHKRRHSNLHLVLGVVSLGTVGLLVSLLVIIYCTRSRRRWCKENRQNIDKLLLKHGSLAPKRYTSKQVKKMTKCFRDKLGQGGFGIVYKGVLPDGQLVAVKVLKETHDNADEFINEVASISRTSHVNIVNLLGFCFEKKKRALVYEYMPNKSLDKFIHKSCSLEWKKLYEVAVGVARGLEYLHRGCNTRIVHFDIKPQNILLDKDFCPKISDFGLSKLCMKKQSAISMLGMRGTIGYIAPEVFSRNFGMVSHKSDVYSYGIMLLHMVESKYVEMGSPGTSENCNLDRVYEHVLVQSERADDRMSEEEEETVRRMVPRHHSTASLCLYNGSVWKKSLTAGGNPRVGAIYLVRLDWDGILRLYNQSLEKEDNWKSIWSVTEDKCLPKGLCGINSYCTNTDGGAQCTCLPGFDIAREGEWSAGCTSDFKVDCRDTNQSRSYVMRSVLNAARFLSGLTGHRQRLTDVQKRALLALSTTLEDSVDGAIMERKTNRSIISMLGTRGPIGYIAPEVFSRNFGIVSHKSDVYSYGIMLLRMAETGTNVETKSSQSSEHYFLEEIYENVVMQNEKIHDLMTEEEEEVVRKMLMVGFWCTQTAPLDRPSMNKVVDMLQGNLKSIQIPPMPFLLSSPKPQFSCSLPLPVIVETYAAPYGLINHYQPRGTLP
ncbi:hypothetical protein SASPL_146837 [Salvia splendens]|uniref:non-specific serine/threonine protein kinase n=1 Tax=Salvia splendens TaxID=180675 RepID=A0A8X8WE26_SALSN|nr:hypothetical protein SASPL_146837 [Salvia splendens]